MQGSCSDKISMQKNAKIIDCIFEISVSKFGYIW